MFARRLRIPVAWGPLFEYLLMQRARLLKISTLQASEKETTLKSENSPHAAARYQASPWAVTPRKSLQPWWEVEKTGHDALGWEGVVSQTTVYVWNFDFTRLLPILHCDFDVQQFKSHPADFGVPVALRKWSFAQMHYFSFKNCVFQQNLQNFGVF